MSYVLRKKPPGELLPKAHMVRAPSVSLPLSPHHRAYRQIDREFAMIEKLHAVSFPVPRPYLYCRDASIIGTEFYIMEFVEVCHTTMDGVISTRERTTPHHCAHVSPWAQGRIFRDAQLPDCSPWERSHIYKAMTDTLALLHSLDWKKIGLEDFFRGANFLERQVWHPLCTLGYVMRRAQVNIWGQQYFLASTIGVCPVLCCVLCA
jgi:acyl-CoA dehydrogenase family protein 11